MVELDEPRLEGKILEHLVSKFELFLLLAVFGQYRCFRGEGCSSVDELGRFLLCGVFDLCPFVVYVDVREPGGLASYPPVQVVPDKGLVFPDLGIECLEWRVGPYIDV